jgi:hypothetical protein
MLQVIRGQASARKLYLLKLACTRRMCRLKSDGVAAMAALEAAAEAADPEAAVRALDAALHRFGFNNRPWDMAEISARGPRVSRGQKHSPPLIRDIFGNPFRPVAFDPAWRTSDVTLLARGIYEEKAFDRMPILADALQEAGCEVADLLDHLRDRKQTHVRGCWALDLVLGKE